MQPSTKCQSLVNWFISHNPIYEKIPQDLLYDGWVEEVYIKLSQNVILKDNEESHNAINRLHEAVMINAIFCWAMEQEQAPNESVCIICGKKAYKGDPIFICCKQHRTKGMHVLCAVDNVMNPCPICKRMIFKLNTISKYVGKTTKTDDGDEFYISHINGERRVRCITSDGKPIINGDTIQQWGQEKLKKAMCQYIMRYTINKQQAIPEEMRFAGWLETIYNNEYNIIKPGQKQFEIYTTYILPAIEKYIDSLPRCENCEEKCTQCGNHKPTLQICFNHGFCRDCCISLMDNNDLCPICNRKLLQFSQLEKFV